MRKTTTSKAWPRKAKFVVCPLYGTTMWFIQDAETWSRCREFMGLGHDQPSGGRATLDLHVQSGDYQIMVGVFDGELSTLAHECGHVAFWILHHVGVKLQNNGSNEAYCYLLQTLFDLFLPLMEPK